MRAFTLAYHINLQFGVEIYCTAYIIITIKIIDLGASEKNTFSWFHNHTCTVVAGKFSADNCVNAKE